jgi:hypothetical protein
MGHITDLLGQPKAEVGPDPMGPYYTALDQLTAEGWSTSG